MESKVMLSKAIEIVAKEFATKLDKGGNPYILHCLYVMNEVKEEGIDAMIVAVLHDIIEDTEIKPSELIHDYGFNFETITKISTLTHQKGESYMDYIKRVSTDDICRKIKLADLRHNSDITRIKGLTKKDFERMEKYHIAYEYLKKV
jgi:(p)ppGpp synthase/HD superfamily hydrolase